MLALDDHAALLARVRQHLLAGVGVRRIALVQDRHAALGEPAADEPQLHRAGADVGELRARKEHLGWPARSRVKNSASAIGMPSSTFLSEDTEGLTRFCSISEMRPLVTPARFASSRCDRPYICRTALR